MTWFRSLRRLLDAWSVPHFLFGMVTALGAIALGWSLLLTFFTTLLVAVLWEKLERRWGIQEKSGNPGMDILLPLLSFGMTLLLVDQAPLHTEEHFALFISVLLLFVFTNAAAWRARIEKDTAFLH